MALWPEDPARRCLVVGAIAGVVLELTLTGAFLASRWLPESGLAPELHRTLELLPFVVVGGAAFVVGAGAFVLAILLVLWPRPATPGRAAGGRATGPARPVRGPRPVSGASGGRPTRGRRS